MAAFDSHWDHPEQVLQEGETLEISFDRLTSTTGRVSWKIPTPADGCNSDNQAYNGIVVVLNTVANTPKDRPTDGTRYTADPSADKDLHAGDTVGDALVIGAFYDDKTTTSFDVSDLQEGAAYFVTGHIVDKVNRYHTAGVSAYSLPLEINPKGEETKPFHEITLNESAGGVLPTDSTGLEIGILYDFFITINNTEYQIRLEGENALTFGDLVNEINRQFLLLDNPAQGTEPPNTGAYYYDISSSALFQWTGFEHNELEVINHPSQPDAVTNGDYWLDTDSGSIELFLRDSGAWVLQTPQVVAGYDVLSPPCDVWWYESVGSSMYKWNGSTWCQYEPVFVQPTDPSDPEQLQCGSFWLNSEGILFEWTETVECNRWIETEAISWETRPDMPNPGTLWFNDTTNVLSVWSVTPTPTWQEVSDNVFVTDTQPTMAAEGSYWYNPTTGELFRIVSGAFVERDAIVFGSDPTAVKSCQLWFDTTSEQLYTWDVVNSEWDLVSQFFDQDNDPSEPTVLSIGSIWVDNTDPSSYVFYHWDGSQFIKITRTDVVVWGSDPTQVPNGTIWYNPVSDMYFELVAGVWNLIDPIMADEDPSAVTLGTFWFNTTNNTLNQWNGSTWIPIGYSTSPFTPAKGTLWYDNNTNQLFEWNGNTYVVAEPKATAELNATEPEGDIVSPDGNIVFTSNKAGSFGNILIGEATVPSDQVSFPQTQFRFEGNLFNVLNPVTALIKRPVVGTDPLETKPMYEVEGVGTDGTVDQRRELIDSIKKQLGYPVIDVELTHKQMDEAVQSALEELRLRSAAAYRRVYFMMDAEQGKQRYILTSKAAKFNTIVNIMGIWRVTSAFQSTAYAAGVYGQTVIQHLYHMGTFDLVSYHLISDYIEQLEQLFATRVTFTWNERSRQLDIFQSFTRSERLLVDAVIEKTEQELLTDRWTKNWLERWALGQAQLTLSEIRGKFSTLPGAGGGISLNASDLENRARTNMEICLNDIDDFVVNDVENLGIGSEIVIG